MSKIGIWENAEPGVKRKVLPTGDSLMMMVVQFEAGAEGYMHQHVHEQMSYCLEGSFEFTIDGVTQLLRAGENISIPSNALHGVKALEASSLLDVFTPLRQDILGNK